MQKILLGPAGSPEGSTLEGVRKLSQLGLHWMEVQFSHGVKMNLDLVRNIGEEGKKFGIGLSIHAPYYINLASEDGRKRADSKRRILESCERGHLMGAKYVVFHPAYFGNMAKEACFQTTRDAINDIRDVIKEKGWSIQLAPETTGKHSSLGSLEETVRLVSETGCFLCVDIAHLYARGLGTIDYQKVFSKLEFIKKDLHFHFSGIAFSAAGEKNHLVINGKPDFRKFAEEILNRKINCSIVSESPVTWVDSLKMKKIFMELGYQGFGKEEVQIPKTGDLSRFY